LTAREAAFHPYGAQVLAVLHGVLVEGPHLGEAELTVKGDRCVIGQDNARKGDMHRFTRQASEQRVVQGSADALAAARDAERDADFDGLPEPFMLPVRLAGGIAEDVASAPGNEKPVRAGRREAPMMRGS
jgi:hypothetical protein